MSYKNKFFKTTIGVAFELVTGITAKAATGAGLIADFQAFVIAAVVGDYQAFAFDKSSSPKGLTFGTPLTDAQKKLPIAISYATEKSGGKATVITHTPIIGHTIRAVNSPYKAATNQDAKIVRISGTAQVTQELVLRIIETTPANNALPSYDYNARIVTTAAAAYASLASQINAGKESEFFTAVAITDGIQVISTDPTRHFRLAMKVIESRTQQINDTVWQYTVNTPAYAGSGSPDQIRQLIYESDVKRGITTQYPHDGMSPLDFGSATTILTLGGATNYDVVTIVGTKFEDSPTPIEIHHNTCYLFVVVPAGQGAAIAATFP